MNEFIVFFLIVSIFAFDAYCMDPPRAPLDLPPPPAPRTVQFGDCFTVHDIRGPSLVNDVYNYNHICPIKNPDNEPEPTEDEKAWYIVGWLNEFDPAAPPADYIKVKQSLIKFTFLRDGMVEFDIGTSVIQEYTVEFQSLQDSQAFYAIIYHSVNLISAADIKIGVLHEINMRGNIEMGKNVEALTETIHGKIYTTFKNEQGKPLLIFARDETHLERITRSQTDRLQLMLRVHVTHYILTFSNNAKARRFSVALSHYIRKLNMEKVFTNVKNRYLENQITVDSSDESTESDETGSDE